MLNTLFTNPLTFVIVALAILVAITIHEFSHAYMADHLGDPTPRLAGRLSLNPLVHLDLFGLIFLLFVGFGWGKPVGFDPFNLRNPRKDTAFIALAGPFSNFILAIVFSLLIKLFILFKLYFLVTIGSYLIYWNLLLGIFNLLPIHPLDGFSIVGGLLPEEKAKEWQGLQRYGFIFLLLLIIPLGNTPLINTLISPILSFFLNLLLPQTAGII